jgi:hypothetical protein
MTIRRSFGIKRKLVLCLVSVSISDLLAFDFNIKKKNS